MEKGGRYGEIGIKWNIILLIKVKSIMGLSKGMEVKGNVGKNVKEEESHTSHNDIIDMRL
jgi:hypothetical protein